VDASAARCFQRSRSRQRRESRGCGCRQWGNRPAQGGGPARHVSYALRFYAGLTVEETAKTTERTVMREWAYARAWLHDVLGPVGDW